MLAAKVCFKIKSLSDEVAAASPVSLTLSLLITYSFVHWTHTIFSFYSTFAPVWWWKDFIPSCVLEVD